MAKSTSKLFESETPKEMAEDAMNLPEELKESIPEETIPEESTEVITTPPASTDDVQDIDLSVTSKKRFRINGDPNKILELNTSDLSISSRLTVAYNRLLKYMEDVSKALEGLPDDADGLTSMQEELIDKQLHDIDAKMRKEVDYIFDAPVSEVCAGDGSMYDPFEGQLRFEHIIEALSKLYETNLSKEFNLMKKQISIKTSKYTKKYHN